jgi:FAD synthetase
MSSILPHANVRRVLAFGTFDDLHPGHLSYLSQAAAQGELYVVVALDAHVQAFKGHPPLQSQEERMKGVQAAFPDAVVSLGDVEDFLAPVRRIKPDLIILGYDQRLPPGVTEELLGCAVLRAQAYLPDVHKSSLRRKKA